MRGNRNLCTPGNPGINRSTHELSGKMASLKPRYAKRNKIRGISSSMIMSNTTRSRYNRNISSAHSSGILSRSRSALIFTFTYRISSSSNRDFISSMAKRFFRYTRYNRKRARKYSRNIYRTF